MQWHREKLTDDGDPFADEYLSCEHCQARCDKATRSMWHCGYVPTKDWTGIGFQLPPAAPESTICPGYTISLPEVFEAARALSWRRDGHLRDLYDEPITGILRDYTDIFNLEIRRIERHELTVMRQQQKRQAQKYGHQ